MAKRLAALLLTLVVLPFALWGAVALWSRLPFGEPWRPVAAAAWLALLLAVLVLAWRGRLLAGTAGFAAAAAALLAWWATILPSDSRDWVPDMAHIATATIDGDVLTVNHVRNFRWATGDTGEPRWETRTYRLSVLQGADLFLSYWAGESIAHAIISFDFADSDPLAFSVEIRKEKGEVYSATAGFFKTYELAIIAADERDVVKVRSTLRGEDLRIFRLDIERATALGLLRQYVALTNDVAAHPRWYNTLTANCTTLIYGMARRLDPRIRLDARILLPGRLPEYLREHDFVTRDVSLEELVARSRIGPRAAGDYPDPGFSPRIRQGVPVPVAQRSGAR